MTISTEITSKNHFTYLQNAYSEVGERTWLTEDFLESNLEVSRNLFTPESLATRCPRPRELEVYALLSGISFVDDFVNKLVRVQQNISALLGESLHYWVAPNNLGLEYCVFKWPNDSLKEEWLDVIHDALRVIRCPSYRFSIRGVQINPDGCVVARGFDEGGILFKLREQIKAKIPFLPPKQSGWAHVPLGRILEPLGAEKFIDLGRLVGRFADSDIAATEINTMKLVHETRWYMEEKTVLSEYPLLSGVSSP